MTRRTASSRNNKKRKQELQLERSASAQSSEKSRESDRIGSQDGANHRPQIQLLPSAPVLGKMSIAL